MTPADIRRIMSKRGEYGIFTRTYRRYADTKRHNKAFTMCLRVMCGVPVRFAAGFVRRHGYVSVRPSRFMSPAGSLCSGRVRCGTARPRRTGRH